MKRIILLMLLNVAFGCIAWSQGFEWALRAGLWAYDYGYGITTDKSGNVYLAGKYEKKANFSGTILPIQGNHDIYVAKYSPSGALIWIRTAGGSTGDYATCIAIDDSHVYIAGEIEGTGKITFVGSSITLYGKGSNDVFLAKYDLNGNLIWARRDGYKYWDKAHGITCDGSGNLYVCGYFKTKVIFGSTTLMGYGEEDIFLAKYDKDGDFIWARRAGGPGKDEAKEIIVDAAGNAYITGMFRYTADFSGTTVSSIGGSDIYLAKYSSGGNFQWVKRVGSTHNDIAWSMTIDQNDKILIAGDFNSSMDFGNGIKLTTVGNSDVFVARYNTSGTPEWANRAGGPLLDRARGIGTDGSNIFITGQYGGTATFGNYTHTAIDSADIFFSALNNDGEFLWTSVAKGAIDSLEELGYESGITICAKDGNVYASGAMLEGGVFGGTTLNPYKNTDIFITKIKHGSGGGGTTNPAVLIYPNAPWLYYDNGLDLGTAWKEFSYNISGWKSGNAQFGYGDGDEATVVSYGSSKSDKYITTYFRRMFNILNTTTVSGLELSLLRDDGAVVYINGNEVHRSNMPSGTIYYNTLAKYGVGSQESTYYKQTINSSGLINGTNIIAVEVHQAEASSSDLSFNLKLETISGSKTNGDNLEPFSVELLSFDAEEKANNVYLSWVTASEMNNEYFIIERSEDEEFFRKVGMVMGAGNSTGAVKYAFIDSSLGQRVSRDGAKLFYRLNFTDYDGIASYSRVISVSIAPMSNISISGKKITFNIYPNPVKQSFTLAFSEMPATLLTYRIYDITGKIIQETNILNERTDIDVSSFIPGVYMIGIKSDKEIIFTEKIIVQDRDSKF